MEKDYSTAVMRHSEAFIALTNHDLGAASSEFCLILEAVYPLPTRSRKQHTSAAKFVAESGDRRTKIFDNWHSKIKRAAREVMQNPRTNRACIDGIVHKCLPVWPQLEGKDGAKGLGGCDSSEYPIVEDSISLTRPEIIHWVTAYARTNECTHAHFATILDPKAGRLSGCSGT